MSAPGGARGGGGGGGPGAVTLRAPAKLNLFLEVLGERPDGFHEIATVMHAVDLADSVALAPREEPGTHLAVSPPDAAVPAGAENLCVRAAELVRHLAGRTDGLEIRLEKHIPVGAGLGGGSSDAAAVIKGLDRLWSLGLGRDQMLRLAARLGSDVPFFIQGGTALCTGRGEIVEPLPETGELTFALNLPQLVVSTRDVYKKVKSFLTENVKNVNLFIEALETGDPRLWGPAMFNRLEGPAFGLHPELAASRESLAGLRFAGVRMSGSGAALFGVAASGREAESLAREARASLSGRTVVVRTCAP